MPWSAIRRIVPDQIARRVPLRVEIIREELAYWVAKGLVEVLRPVAAAMQDESDEVSGGSGGDYYRWIRPTDADYMWQAELLSRRPPPPRDSRRRDYDLLPLMHI